MQIWVSGFRPARGGGLSWNLQSAASEKRGMLVYRLPGLFQRGA